MMTSGVGDRRRGLSFRTRLTLTMLATFVLAGIALVWVMNALVQVTVTATLDSSEITPDHYEVVDGERVPVAVGEVQGQQVGYLGPDQLRQLVWLSVLVIIVFALVAWVLSRWLTKRALMGIQQVTDTTRRINEHDLSQRLALTGSEDEVTELADTIDEMLDRLQRAFEAQGRFAANASHELRTPLTVTQTSLEVPLEQGLIGEEARPDVERALGAAKQSEELIGALLVLADSRQIRVDECQPCDVSELLNDEADTFAQQAKDAEVTVERVIPPGITTDADRVLLRRAIDNLIGNAIAYNEPGGYVRVSLAQSDHSVFLQVENTGQHLDPEMVLELVEPFNRGPRGRSSQAEGRRGFGLGLAIVESIAAAHGGALSLEARTGGGLVARLELLRANQVTER